MGNSAPRQGDVQSIGHIDIRPAATAQKQLQEVADSSSRVTQLMRLRNLAENGRPAQNPQAEGPVLAQPNANAGVVQQQSIDPGAFFDATRDADDIDATIDEDVLAGFGSDVDDTVWHTKLEFGPLVTPGVQNGVQMAAEGSSVAGVIGPDHAYGSQPGAGAIGQNIHLARQIRGNGSPSHVAAHIVNDQLGGPGSSQNLFAFPGNSNTLMETQVEGRMKQAVAGGNYIFYTADVHHPAIGPADYIRMSWNKLDYNGEDIGAGQNNVVIQSDNTAQNTAVVDPVDDGILVPEARNSNLQAPINALVIKNAPWGPFQMPDPKIRIVLDPYLDYTQFPAVGNPEAFRIFLDSNKDKPIKLNELFANFPNTTMFNTIGTWIQGGTSGVTTAGRRGVTPAMVAGMINGREDEKQTAFAAAIRLAAGAPIVPRAAALLASEARNSAADRVCA